MAASDQGPQDLLQTALDTQLDTFFLFDPETERALKWNRTFREVSGYSDEEIADLPAPASYYDAEDLERAGPFMARVLEEGVGTIELDLVCKDGRRIPTEYRVAVVRGADGAPTSIISVGRDISERRRLEGRLELISQGIENSLNGFDIVGEDLTFEYCNLAYAKMFGYPSPEAVIGRDATVHAANPGDAARIVAALKAEGRFIGEFVGRRVDGSTFDVQMFARRDTDELGRAIIVSTSLDITERRRAATSLRESERRLATLMKNLPGAAYRCRSAPGWPMEFISEGIQRITGRPASDFVGDDARLYEDVIHPDDRDMVWRETQAGLRSTGAFDIEYRIVDTEGATRWVSEQGRTESTDDDGELRLEGYIADVTKLRSLETQLHQAQKIEAVGRLAGGVAHDFNNLLTVINNSCDLMLDEVHEGDALRTDLDAIRRAASRATELTRQLLAFSRKQVIRPHRFDLHAHLEQSRTMLTPLLGEDTALEIHAEANPAEVWFDPGQLEQILLNLAVNAKDAMPRGGRLSLRTEGPGPGPDLRGAYLLLVVEDDGAGMSHRDLEKIFEPFFTTKDVGKGTGLGLATVYGIVAQHGGLIEAASTLGEGTSFSIFLPTTDPRASTDEPNATLPAVDAEAAPSTDLRGTETVLVIEDEPSVLDITCRILSARGYRVLCASSGAEALSVARRTDAHIDLVLSDVVMAGLSGVDAVDALRRTQPDLRVLFMSGHPRDMLAPRGALAPAARLIEKPFTAKALTRAVRAALDAPPSE